MWYNAPINQAKGNQMKFEVIIYHTDSNLESDWESLPATSLDHALQVALSAHNNHPTCHAICIWINDSVHLTVHPDPLDQLNAQMA